MNKFVPKKTMKTLGSPDFLYFDLGKVLLEFSHDMMCEQMAEVVGIEMDRAKEIVFGSGLGDQYESGQIDSEQFCDSFFDSAGGRSNPSELLRAGSDIFQLKTEMLPLVANLAVSGLPLGILSNTCPAHWEWVENQYAFLRQFFCRTILSYEVRAMKPDNEIYRCAIRQAGKAPGKIFFVDDRIENVEGARAAGMDAHLFESVQQVQDLLLARGISINY